MSATPGSTKNGGEREDAASDRLTSSLSEVWLVDVASVLHVYIGGIRDLLRMWRNVRHRWGWGRQAHQRP